MTDDFDAFVGAQWAAHESRPDEVAQRLAESVARVRTPAQVGPYAALVAHVYGVHLGAWDRGAEVLRSLRRAPGHDGGPLAEGPLARGLAALALASGDEAAADGLAPADRVAALASASSALLDREAVDRAIALYGRALDLAAATPLPDDSPAVRALAVGGNNLAATLEDRRDRTPAQAAAMLRAAEAALAQWQRCGGGLEHERAEYRLARSALRADQPDVALAAARRCVAICERDALPPFERFFGHAMVALAQAAAGNRVAAVEARSRALAACAAVPAEDQAGCRDDLDELRATLGDLP